MGSNQRYGDPMTPLDPLPIGPPPVPRPQHVWVNLSTVKHATAEYPGLLLEWRRTSWGWEALCAWASDEGSVHFGWVVATKLRPARDGESS